MVPFGEFIVQRERVQQQLKEALALVDEYRALIARLAEKMEAQHDALKECELQLPYHGKLACDGSKAFRSNVNKEVVVVLKKLQESAHFNWLRSVGIFPRLLVCDTLTDKGAKWGE